VVVADHTRTAVVENHVDSRVVVENFVDYTVVVVESFVDYTMVAVVVENFVDYTMVVVVVENFVDNAMVVVVAAAGSSVGNKVVVAAVAESLVGNRMVAVAVVVVVQASTWDLWEQALVQLHLVDMKSRL
jgi:hypothetical protein